MKVRIYHWLTLLLLETISVSPNSSSIASVTTNLESSSSTLASIDSTKLDTFQNLLLTTPISHITNIYQNMLLNPSPIFHKKRDTAQSFVIPPCHKFEIGDTETNTFYSPNYPDNYPKNIDCVRVLEAPEGNMVRLDFRNSFKIEDKEDCKFDYLEIRDGPYGYSKEMGRYCGEKFPEIILSSGRHLWLHFHSDESIEYSGFTAVYEFVKKSDKTIVQELNCTILKEGPDGYINSTDVPPEIIEKVKSNGKIPLDCMWVVRVREGWKIQIKFLKFTLDKPNDCDVNFVDIFKEHTDMTSRLKNFCGSAGDSVSSETNVLHVRFFADVVALKSEFSILYTAYREKTTNCEDDEYDCEDATCISAELKCNKRDNCKFRWDEDGCEDETQAQSEHVVIIIIVFALILGGMVVTFLVNCIRKLLKDQKIIREHIRQSKESKLDEMGRGSAMRSKENLSVKLSPSEKQSQSSFQILDDVSNRYYREIVPISVQNSKIDLKKGDSILRHHRDIVVQTSLGESLPFSERGTCEMACQTRESLFQPIVRQKSITSSSPNQSLAAIRFSTFGYDVPPPPPPSKQKLTRQSTNKSRTTPPTTIELEDLGITQVSKHRQIPEVCHHHHQHQQHLQQQQQHRQQQQQFQHQNHPINSGKGGKQPKIDETKVFIDIRNSAPDVIIMTSH